MQQTSQILYSFWVLVREHNGEEKIHADSVKSANVRVFSPFFP